MNATISLNVPQTVFCLFYAISLGFVANAQLKWKAFDWPLALAGRTDAAYRPSLDRIWRAAWYLAVLPILLFLLILTVLSALPAHDFGLRLI
jgi:hypothetical protein